jgi:hypothetical protein
VATVITVTRARHSWAIFRCQPGILMPIIGGHRRRQRCSVWSALTTICRPPSNARRQSGDVSCHFG